MNLDYKSSLQDFDVGSGEVEVIAEITPWVPENANQTNVLMFCNVRTNLGNAFIGKKIAGEDKVHWAKLT